MFRKKRQGFCVMLLPVEVRTAPSWTTLGVVTDHQDSLPPSLLYLSPQDLALTQWQPVGTTFLSQTYALTDDSFMVFLSRMRSYSKARSARNWKLTQINLKRNTQLSFWFHTFIWKVKW